MIRNILAVFGFSAFLGACGQPPGATAGESDRERPATGPVEPVEAALTAADGSAAGRVVMRQGPQGLLFTIEGEGWPPGWHATHLHAVGACDAPAFEAAGDHLDHASEARPHGLLNWDGGPDLGDLQNIHADADGRARAEVYLGHAGLDIGDLADGDGLAFVVHAGADDHSSQPIGGAGDRIACAVLYPGDQAASV